MTNGAAAAVSSRTALEAFPQQPLRFLQSRRLIRGGEMLAQIQKAVRHRYSKIGTPREPQGTPECLTHLRVG